MLLYADTGKNSCQLWLERGRTKEEWAPTLVLHSELHKAGQRKTLDSPRSPDPRGEGLLPLGIALEC